MEFLENYLDWNRHSASVGGWRRTSKRRRQVRTITTTRTTTTRQTRTGIRYRVTPVIEQQPLGTRVVSVEHIQFMRSRNIELKARNQNLELDYGFSMVLRSHKN